jgi:DNA invertase Pin-like site-specific DNA recombinase
VTVSPESLVNEKSGAGSPSVTGKAASKRRAVGIVRVSHVGGRGGESFVSPTDQVKRIRAECRRLGLRLLEPVVQELDVSGRTPLEHRQGLRGAVEMIENHSAEAIVVAYMDRLVRKESIRYEVVERVERAGGEIYSMDHGALTNGNAAQRLQSGVVGLFNEYTAALGGERSREGKVAAVARGVAPYPNIPPGLKRGGADGKGPLELDSQSAESVRDAFRMRAGGATIAAVRVYLREQGIARSLHGVQAMLQNHIYIGELRFGDLVNREIPALIDVATFNRAQRQHVPRGPRPKSERLLARLAVLRCATCEARMVVGTTRQQGKSYSFYRCPPLQDCPRRVTIGAAKAEQAVEAEVRRRVTGMKGKASGETGAQQAAREFDRRQAELDSATRVVLGAGLAGEASATERLAELRQARDDAAERLEELESIDAPSVVLDAAEDWDSLSLEGRRGIIRALLARALVAPGRGDDRITFEARS